MSRHDATELEKLPEKWAKEWEIKGQLKQSLDQLSFRVIILDKRVELLEHRSSIQWGQLRMIILVAVSIAVSVALTSIIPPSSWQETQQQSHMIKNPALDRIWQEFKEKFLKKYKDGDHESKRRHIFEDNLELIIEHNIEADLGKHTFRLGLNPFADWSREEFLEILNLRYNASRVTMETETETDDDQSEHVVMVGASSGVPDSIDWVQKGAVTPVKDQGECRACYAFSATGALEGALFIKTGKLVSLSEQNILDCSQSQGNLGCNGGVIPYAFRYVKQNGGIDTEQSYPYTGKVGTCSYVSSNSAGSCTGFRSLAGGNESSLQQAVGTVGPVSVAIDASTIPLYRSGVYSSSRCSSSNLNHAVLVVGYGTASNGQQYWKVKNSWGKSWGMDGYIEIARNDNNMCGIASTPAYPTV